MELSYISRKAFQNPGLFRTWSIFRILSDILQRFAKIARKIIQKKKYLYFLIFWVMELSRSNIKIILIFSQKKAFLIFQETETQKNFLYFSRELPRSKNETNLLWKNVLYFGKWNFLAASLKTSYISVENLQDDKQKMIADLICILNVSNKEFLGF